MKCDELTIYDDQWYDKFKAEVTIAELKAENEQLKAKLETVNELVKTSKDMYDRTIESLKASSHYAEMVDAGQLGESASGRNLPRNSNLTRRPTMATINYNGMELKEFKERKVFDEPFEMCVWNDNDGLPTVRFVCAVIPYRHVGQVITTNGAFEHCALLPDPPKPRRATNRELARWLIEGNAQIRHSDSDMVYVGWNYKEFEDDLPCSNNVLVRKWSDAEWREPTVDYMGLEDV